MPLTKLTLLPGLTLEFLFLFKELCLGSNEAAQWTRVLVNKQEDGCSCRYACWWQTKQLFPPQPQWLEERLQHGGGCRGTLGRRSPRAFSQALTWNSSRKLTPRKTLNTHQKNTTLLRTFRKKTWALWLRFCAMSSDTALKPSILVRRCIRSVASSDDTHSPRGQHHPGTAAPSTGSHMSANPSLRLPRPPAPGGFMLCNCAPNTSFSQGRLNLQESRATRWQEVTSLLVKVEK